MIFAAAGNCSDEKGEHRETQADRRKEAELRRKRLLDDVFAGKIPKLRRMFPLACSEFYCSGRRSLDVVSSVALVADSF
nr:hypothetical protein Iba_chr08cCG11270 [Ipomoea batatas]